MQTKPHVIFYTRPGCYLCDEARREIARADCADLFTYEEVDIDSDPDLRRRYGWDIPVVLVNNTRAFKHRLTAEEFRRAIRKARGT
jgi:glutaredoxin